MVRVANSAWKPEGMGERRRVGERERSGGGGERGGKEGERGKEGGIEREERRRVGERERESRSPCLKPCLDHTCRAG